jgi:hypothetical protein
MRLIHAPKNFEQAYPLSGGIFYSLVAVVGLVLSCRGTPPEVEVIEMTSSSRVATGNRETDRIQPWSKDQRYWQYRGEPILLIGASNEDNLFNHPDLPPDGLVSHLAAIADAGANYVRNTMSSRDESNVWPFEQDPESGLYDLRRPGEEYWRRFQEFLQETAKRRIIVQIEVWDRFDYARQPWQANPFNPKNNVNYTAEQSGLAERIDSHPGRRENAFFRSVPQLENNRTILPFQQAHVQRMINMTLDFDHVLYCVSNETNDTEAWSRYWAKFIRQIAADHGKGIELTEMWDDHNVVSAMHGRTYDHPRLYSFVDVSQNSHQVGQAQWDNLQAARKRVADPPRPVNSVKTYGGSHGGGASEGQHKLWRNILGGAASSRYHRPGGGIGFNEVTAAHLRSVRMVQTEIDLIQASPANHLLGDREADEAYLATIPGRAYAVYFPEGGSVTLDTGEAGTLTLRWLNVRAARWHDKASVKSDGKLQLTTPGSGPWAAVLATD